MIIDWTPLLGDAENFQFTSVLFDLDCTLHDRTTGLINFARHYGEKLLLNESDTKQFADLFIALDKKGMVSKQTVYEQLAEVFEIDIDPHMAEQRYWRDYPRFAIEIPHATQTLRSLAKINVPVGLITNGPSVLQHAVIDALDIRKYFGSIIVSEDVAVSKPDRRIFELGLQALGAQAETTLYVGDNEITDIQGAMNAGMNAVLYGSIESQNAVISTNDLRDIICLCGPK